MTFEERFKPFGFSALEMQHFLEKNNAFIAGGFALAAYLGVDAFKGSDIDIYLPEIITDEQLILKGYSVVHYNKYPMTESIRNVVTYTRGYEKIQLVVVKNKNPYDILNEFDIDICKVMITSSLSIVSHCLPYVKRMRIVGVEYPDGLYPRTVKYISRGFTLVDNNDNEIVDTLKHVNEILKNHRR